MERQASRGREQLDLLREIFLYLEMHPDALDTADGIARWWIHRDTRIVYEMLEALTIRGVIQQRKLAGLNYYTLHGSYRGVSAEQIIKTLIRTDSVDGSRRARRAS